MCHSKKRLIDATDWDSFYADMGDSRNTMDSYDRGYTDALDRVDDWMDAQPTVDAVEVVRCKDCKHWQLIHEHIPHMECQIFCGAYEHGYPTNADDFCSYGERRTDERKAD